MKSRRYDNIYRVIARILQLARRLRETDAELYGMYRANVKRWAP